jgi:hypothetical protein
LIDDDKVRISVVFLISCFLSRSETRVPQVVDNDGLHGMEKKSGLEVLAVGQHVRYLLRACCLFMVDFLWPFRLLC